MIHVLSDNHQTLTSVQSTNPIQLNPDKSRTEMIRMQNDRKRLTVGKKALPTDSFL